MARWSRAYIDRLPDSAFLYIEPGGRKESNRTRPLRLRHFPVRNKSGSVDEAHLENALQRLGQAKTLNHIRPAAERERLKDRLQQKARRLGHEEGLLANPEFLAEEHMYAGTDDDDRVRVTLPGELTRRLGKIVLNPSRRRLPATEEIYVLTTDHDWLTPTHLREAAEELADRGFEKEAAELKAIADDPPADLLDQPRYAANSEISGEELASSDANLESQLALAEAILNEADVEGDPGEELYDDGLRLARLVQVLDQRLSGRAPLPRVWRR